MNRNFQQDFPFVFLKGKRFIHAEEKPEYPFACRTALGKGDHQLRLCQLLCYLGKAVGEVTSVLCLILFHTDSSRMKYTFRLSLCGSPMKLAPCKVGELCSLRASSLKSPTNDISREE